MRLTIHHRAGAEEPVTLPCGVEVVLRVLAPADMDDALRRATRRSGVDTAYGLAVERQLRAKAASEAGASPGGQLATRLRTEAERALAANPNDPAAGQALADALTMTRGEVDVAYGRGRSRLLAQDPEAYEALEGLARWNLAMCLEVAASALVECAALADEGATTWRPATLAEAAARLLLVQPADSQAVLLGELYGAAQRLSELGTLGKARSAPPSGSTTASAETAGAAAAQIAPVTG